MAEIDNSTGGDLATATDVGLSGKGLAGISKATYTYMAVAIVVAIIIYLIYSRSKKSSDEDEVSDSDRDDHDDKPQGGRDGGRSDDEEQSGKSKDKFDLKKEIEKLEKKQAALAKTVAAQR